MNVGHGIIAAGVKWVAAKNATHCHPTALQNAKLSDRLNGIL
jgi:hypothetical protein